MSSRAARAAAAAHSSSGTRTARLGTPSLIVVSPSSWAFLDYRRVPEGARLHGMDDVAVHAQEFSGAVDDVHPVRGGGDPRVRMEHLDTVFDRIPNGYVGGFSGAFSADEPIDNIAIVNAHEQIVRAAFDEALEQHADALDRLKDL